MNQSYKLPQVSNDDSLCADLSLLLPDEEEDRGDMKLHISVAADTINNWEGDEDENEDEDEVPEDDGISDLSQTFLIEHTKTHITERTHEDSATSR